MTRKKNTAHRKVQIRRIAQPNSSSSESSPAANGEISQAAAGANARQVGGQHYSKHGAELQHWDYAALKRFDYFQGQITKYVERWRDKKGIEDLEKALHFLEKYIELVRKGVVKQKESKSE